MRLQGWTLKARRTGPRPRVQASRSVAPAPNQRWATDIALVRCGSDGWCAFVPVIDCCTRQILGWELDLTARAKPLSALWRAPCSPASAVQLPGGHYTRGQARRLVPQEVFNHRDGLHQGRFPCAELKRLRLVSFD